MSDSVLPHRRQPARLPRPWDSPGKNAGVGCHFLLQCVRVKNESEVAQSCPTLSDPMDCSPPGSPSMGFSKQEHWSGVPLPSPPSPGDLPNPKIEPRSPALQADSLQSELAGKPYLYNIHAHIYIYIYIYISESLCCIPETNRILLINYNSINNTTC